MKLSAAKVRKACRERNLRLGSALREAGISRTAYYSLLRSDSVLPKSLVTLAEFLGVPPLRLLDETVGPELRARLLLRRLERILASHPQADRENVWHTLLALEDEPADRLERGLARGAALHPHR